MQTETPTESSPAPQHKQSRFSHLGIRWRLVGSFAMFVALLLMLLGCVREWLALGTVFGTPVGQRAVLPMAGMPAGGFIVLGVVCAIWRALARSRQKYLKNEARGYLAVHPQENRKEAEQ